MGTPADRDGLRRGAAGVAAQAGRRPRARRRRQGRVAPAASARLQARRDPRRARRRAADGRPPRRRVGRARRAGAGGAASCSASTFEVDETLVRGLDYYTHTLFEFQSSALENAQATILGGGRYDGLIEQLGGPPTPGIGFGSGIERVLLSCDAEGVFDAPESTVDCFVVDTTGGEVATALCPGPPRRRRGDGSSLRRAEHEVPDEGGRQERRSRRGRSSARTRRPRAPRRSAI